MLRDGCQYRTNGGATASIMRSTRPNPAWVWSLQGDWYDRESGRFVSHDRTGSAKLLKLDSRLSISNHEPITTEQE